MVRFPPHKQLISITETDLWEFQQKISHCSERVQIWVCLFLCGWYYPGVRLQIWVCLICVISTYSNGAVQIRMGLELPLIFFRVFKPFFSSETRGPGEQGAAGYCPKILLLKRARNRPVSETKFLDDFWGPLSLPAPSFYC